MAIEYYIILSFLLFAIGLTGVLLRTNVIIVFMCIELMFSAVNLLLVAFGKMFSEMAPQNFAGAIFPGADSQIFVLFIMLVAAAEVTIGLAIIVMLYRNIHSVNINFLNRLKH